VSEVSEDELVVECGDQGVLTLGDESVRARLGEQVVLNAGPDLDHGRQGLRGALWVDWPDAHLH
jgi:hypothetical protein